MENNSFQTSFIPKKLLTPVKVDKEPTNFFSIIAIFILVVTIAAAVGLFFYKIYLTKQEVALSDSLSSTRDSFEKSTIDKLELYDKRTKAANLILDNHVVLSPMFQLLGELTIPSIQYTSFDQKNENNIFQVQIRGMARDYRSIALQAEMFNTTKGSAFSNVLFSNLVKDKSNNVSFDLKFNVSPDLLSYKKSDLVDDNQGANTKTAPSTPGVSTLPLDSQNTITTAQNPLVQDLGNTAQ